MKLRARLTLSLMVVLWFFPTVYGQHAKTSSGTYLTYSGDQLYGTESYTLTTNADGSGQSQADVTFGAVKFKATTTVAKNKPVNFVIETGGIRSVVAEISGDSAKIIVPGQTDTVIKAQPAVLLENGVWHQFLFLFAQYDASRAGQQTFGALVPSQAVPFTISLERIDSPSFKAGGQTVSTEHFRAGTSLGLSFEIWIDSSRVPLFIQIGGQRLKIVRKGFEALADAISPPPSSPATSIASASDPYTSEEVTFQNGEQKLAGTLTIPKSGTSPFPAVVIISGSGPQDRDGTDVAGLYRLIADRLSANGIAVLRGDDRGVGKSSIPMKATSYRDLIADSKAALEFLLTRREINPKRIGLAGHSEGAETALTIAAEDARVAAIMMLAGTSRSVDRVLIEQTLYSLALQSPINPSDKTRYPDLVARLEKMFQDAKSKPKPADAASDQLSWFREHAEGDPLALARRVRVPALVLNGERDDSVLPFHALELAQALAASGNRQVLLRVFPNLTHLFTPSKLEKTVTDAQAREVSPEFLDLLRSWTVNVLVHGKDGGAVPEK